MNLYLSEYTDVSKKLIFLGDISLRGAFDAGQKINKRPKFFSHHEFKFPEYYQDNGVKLAPNISTNTHIFLQNQYRKIYFDLSY